MAHRPLQFLADEPAKLIVARPIQLYWILSREDVDRVDDIFGIRAEEEGNAEALLPGVVDHLMRGRDKGLIEKNPRNYEPISYAELYGKAIRRNYAHFDEAGAATISANPCSP